MTAVLDRDAKLKFGKPPAREDKQLFKLSRFLAAPVTGELPTPPLTWAPPQARDIDWRMYSNDRFGCCTIAAAGHMEELWYALEGKKVVPSDKKLLDIYWELSGGVGNDNGLYPGDVLKFWRKQGIDKRKILAYAGIDWKNKQEVKCAIALFGGIYLGFNVQHDCIADFYAGRLWTPGVATGEGHMVNIVGYDDSTVQLVTWGKRFGATWAWLAEQTDEAYVIFPGAWYHHNPNIGINRTLLLKDLGKLRKN